MDNNNQNFSNYTVLDSQQSTGTGVVAKKFMANVFTWMFVALGVSAGLAYLYWSNPTLTAQLFDETTGKPSILFWVVTFAPFGFILIMNFGMQRLSAPALTFLFLVFAAVLGISLSVIGFIYSPNSILACFAAASAMFGTMAVMGYTTEKDLTSFVRILSMGMVGVFVACIINWFMHSESLSYLISIVGVAVFTGLTAYDTQKLKRIGAGLEFEGTSASDTKKLAIMGALNLYLDFLNLFLFLLRLFGGKKS